MAEQRTHKPWVEGSNPSLATIFEPDFSPENPNIGRKIADYPKNIKG